VIRLGSVQNIVDSVGLGEENGHVTMSGIPYGLIDRECSAFFSSPTRMLFDHVD